MCAARKFKRPSENECLRAIGLDPVTRELQHGNIYTGKSTSLTQLAKAVKPDPSRFNPIPKPKPDDWLANHHEAGQTFLEFTKAVRKHPSKHQNTIYLQPLTFFEEGVPPDVLDSLATFASHFFAMPVKLLTTERWNKKVAHRSNPLSGHMQVNAGEILTEMSKSAPSDAFCVSAITMCDLYPRDDWNFVFGLARLGNGVGVYSLARYTPGFFEPGQSTKVDNLSSEEHAALLKRACTLMCHEICHMFGLKHCIHYHCLMNGSNHDGENEKKPLHLCPVCLRKLHFSYDFDIQDRYQNMADFCAENEMVAQTEWFQRAVESL